MLLRSQVPSLRSVMTPAEFAPGRETGIAPAHQRARYRVPAIHLRQHRQPQGRGAHPRQPARQHTRNGPGGAVPTQQRRVRELAAALPRHGIDRRLAGQPLHRLSAGDHVAAGIPVAPAALAVGHSPPSRHAFRGAEFCLRAVPAQDRGRRHRGARSEFVALRVQRRRAGEPRHDYRVSRPLRKIRPARGSDRAGLWAWPNARSGSPSAAGTRAADRPHQARSVHGFAAGACRRATTSATRCAWWRAACRCPGTRCGWSMRPASRSASVRRGGCEFKGPSATSGYYRNPEETRKLVSTATGSTAAITPISSTARSTSAGASRT